MSRSVAVVGGTGKTGAAVRDGLERWGAAARPLGRRELADPAAAFDGCDAVYLIAPNLLADEPAYVTGMLDAMRTAGVERVVYHSVASPYAPSMPHHVGKAVSEDLVRRSGLVWTILQPCAYVQNLIPPLLAGDSLVVPYDVDRPFGLVDLADVGEAAAVVLSDSGHEGATYELGGPGLVSVADVAQAASRVLGRTVEARRLDPRRWARDAGAALEKRERDWLRAMFAYYDAYGLPTGSQPLHALLGRRPTSVEDALRRDLP
ncbi:uncharacterized protein YbjT (DUF2867 family) [Mumia flava]|uniref:Uncharacterized protein YbjT (DUF2867 family) n=1 Tax=Mumia flava TaxID=1348852 RepID=A0A2M9BFD2_9ACTN|nr:NmrA family NAD(P)-binding protein [Mumia flava]PJJ56665.1 uncharacterized protein YbjT (DUF2867 family) [Mumia flava]